MHLFGKVFPAAIKGRTALYLYQACVPAGFPSPADDYLEGEIDLNELLIRNPPATFYVRLAGDSMKAGVHPNRRELLILMDAAP